MRDRLPDAAFPAAWQAADDLGAVADRFDLILLNAYGVLNLGETTIRGAVERVAALRKAGKAVMAVSNSTGYPKARMMQRYATLGFDFTPDEVVTSREVLLAHLATQPQRHWGIMLNADNNLSGFDSIETTLLVDAQRDYDSADGFLLVGSDGWTEARQAMLEATLRDRPRPVLVGNPDIVAPRENGLSHEPGYFAHRMIDATGAPTRFFGKPLPKIFDLALSRTNVEPARILMVGDKLHTDILGGRHMGFATALVTGHGSLLGLDVGQPIRRSGIVPDFVMPRI